MENWFFFGILEKMENWKMEKWKILVRMVPYGTKMVPYGTIMVPYDPPPGGARRCWDAKSFSDFWPLKKKNIFLKSKNKKKF